MKKINKIKKKYYPDGGYFAGNLDNAGVYNNNINKNHIYLNSAEKTLAGIAQGLGSAVGIGGIIQASNDAMGITDQLNKSKEYKTSAGITGGIAGLGMSLVNSFAGMGKPKQNNIESPNTNIVNTGYVTPELNPNNGSTEVNDLTNGGINVWNSLGGPLNSTNSKAKRRIISRKLTDKFYNDLGNLVETPKYGGYNYAFGGKWVPPGTDEQGGTTINGVYYGSQDLANLKSLEAGYIDPNTNQPFKVFNDEEDFKNSYNPIRRMDNALLLANEYLANKVIDKKQYTDPGKDEFDDGQDRKGSFTRNKGLIGKKMAQGGNLNLSEANGGFVHEDPNPMNVNQGIPINNQATIEVGETIFNPENYVFSDRIKVPGKKYTYAQASKKIKNKYKLRPDDKLVKEAINQDLSKLMNQQEALKQTKAEKLMSKVMELNPDIVGNKGNLYPNGGGIPTVNDLYVGNQLQNKKPPYSIFTPPNVNIPQNQYSTQELNPGGTQFIPEPTVKSNNTITSNNTYDNSLSPDNPINNNPVINNPVNTEEELNTRLLSSTQMPKDLSGINAGIFGLQALGEGLRLGLTPNSKLTGNLKFDRVNTYPQEVIAKKAAQEASANLLNAYRNSGVNPSQYLNAVTMGLGDIAQNTGANIANINNQGQVTNAQIQAQEAQLNKELELQRNDIIAQDIANRSNELGAVGAGLAQNINTVLQDKSMRDMDLYSLQFMNKDNYRLISTKEEAEKYGQPIGSYIFVPSGYKEKTTKIKKKYKSK